MPNGPLHPLLLDAVEGLLPETRDSDTDLHAHPELSNQEHRTAAHAAARLTEAGFEVTTGVGTTGVVAVLRNGEGPTVVPGHPPARRRVPARGAPRAGHRRARPG